jgi:hypothetical protein
MTDVRGFLALLSGKARDTAKSILNMNPDVLFSWLPLGFVPGLMPHYRPWPEHGFARAGGGNH